MYFNITFFELIGSLPTHITATLSSHYSSKSIFGSKKKIRLSINFHNFYLTFISAIYCILRTTVCSTIKIRENNILSGQELSSLLLIKRKPLYRNQIAIRMHQENHVHKNTIQRFEIICTFQTPFLTHLGSSVGFFTWVWHLVSRSWNYSKILEYMKR